MRVHGAVSPSRILLVAGALLVALAIPASANAAKAGVSGGP